jgi:hypothetical protein
MADFAAGFVHAMHKVKRQIRVAKIAKPIAFIGDSDFYVWQVLHGAD